MYLLLDNNRTLITKPSSFNSSTGTYSNNNNLSFIISFPLYNPKNSPLTKEILLYQPFGCVHTINVGELP